MIYPDQLYVWMSWRCSRTHPVSWVTVTHVYTGTELARGLLGGVACCKQKKEQYLGTRPCPASYRCQNSKNPTPLSCFFSLVPHPRPPTPRHTTNTDTDTKTNSSIRKPSPDGQKAACGRSPLRYHAMHYVAAYQRSGNELCFLIFSFPWCG